MSFDYRQIHQLLHNDDEGHFMQSDGFFTSLQMLGGYFRRSFFHPSFVDMAITSLKNCITTKVRHLSFHPILFCTKHFGNISYQRVSCHKQLNVFQPCKCFGYAACQNIPSQINLYIVCMNFFILIVTIVAINLSRNNRISSQGSYTPGSRRRFRRRIKEWIVLLIIINFISCLM